ncbi:MAG: aminotransferase class I/II-fold pyridoxal phosphate-dependent enzyme, partial [Acidobacteriota bacterium]|nr:aminotransferase class I/II-fold pyridoxal phosphate-dependent enzyme [Acidobacteriota bacterium]
TLRRLGAELPLDGEPIQKLLNDCRAIFDASRHNGHPRFFGYVASPATAPGAFADLISSALNANVTSWRSGPAATEVERLVVRWLGSLTGFSDNAQGLLMSGGSLANLTAILIAQRAKSHADAAHTGLWSSRTPMTIYASDQIHMSIPKAADVLGLGRNQVRIVATDDHFRMDVRALRALIESDQKNNLQPFCIVASAGTVNTGAVDALDEIGAVAREFGLWLHVDGAYGALAAMDQRKRQLFAGIEQADSLSIDCHKWLYTPLDAGCLLFRDEAVARTAFSANEADYIKVLEQNAEESFAFWDYGVELSRRFRALKIWMTLRYYGLRKISEAISEDISLAEYLAQRVSEAEDFELLAPVELSICCFRYVPREVRAKLDSTSAAEIEQANSELNELNTRIMHGVQRGGEAYISNATVKGKFALRACITNFRTTPADLDALLDIVREVAKRS